MYQPITFLDSFRYTNFEDYKQLSNKKGIYLIRNIVNNNLYVGSTVNSKGLRVRLCHHLNSLKRKEHHNDFLQNSVNKYNINNFKIAILLETTTLTNSKIRELEKEYIDYYGKFFKMFNLADPVDFTVTEYTKQKRTQSLRKIRSDNQGIFVKNGKYTVRISRVINNKQNPYILGNFDTIDEAVELYKQFHDKDYIEIEQYMTACVYKKAQNTKTGYIGVHLYKGRTKPYYARIYHNKQLIHLGYFSTSKEAAIAYNNYLSKHNLITYNRPLNIIKEDNV